MSDISWSRRYRVGVELSKHMETCATLEEIANEFGITKQNAYTETVVALGTLVVRMRERLGVPLDVGMVETPEILAHDTRLGIGLA